MLSKCSYKKRWLSLLFQPDIDNTAIAGFYIEGMYPVNEPTVNLDLNSNGNKTDMGVSTHVMLFKTNPVGLDIFETRADY